MAKPMTKEQIDVKKKRQAAWAKANRAKKKAAAGGGEAKPKKAKKAKSAEKETPAEMGARAKKNHDRKEDAVRRAIKSGSLDAKEVADRIITRYDALKKAEANVSNVGKRAGEAIKGAKNSFEAVIGESVGVEDNGGKAKKLDKLVDAYAELKTMESEGAEKRAKAKKLRKQAHEKFDRAIEESKQPDLPGLESGDDDGDDEESESD